MQTEDENRTTQSEHRDPRSKHGRKQDERATSSAASAVPATSDATGTPAAAAPVPVASQETSPFPPGWEPVSIESLGAWKGEGRIFVKPVGYTLSDSKPSLMRPHERVKPQAVILCEVRSKNGISVQPFGQPKDAPPIVAKSGEYISIWYRPGLRDILCCGGIDTMLQDNGVKHTDRGDMKKFHVVRRQGSRGEFLQLLEGKDFRVETRHMPLPWERQERSDTNGDNEEVYAGGGAWAGEGDDDIPF